MCAAFTLNALFLWLISHLERLQQKHYGGHDGNLFTHFHIPEAEGLTSPRRSWDEAIKAFSSAIQQLLILKVIQWNTDLLWKTTFAAKWVTLWSQEKLCRSFNGAFGTAVNSLCTADIFSSVVYSKIMA